MWLCSRVCNMARSIEFLLFGLFVGCIADKSSLKEVTIKQGKLIGRLYESRNGTQFYGFTSIPFAKPPVGDLRFEPPQDPEPWTGVLNATLEPPLCMQMDLVTFGLPKPFGGQEDCLYLNVYTPEVNNQLKLPVMVWIHGGGFSLGSGGHFHPIYFMDRPVVVITLNYRLGAFGFLSAGDEVLPGNMALKDQTAALRWVRDNIREFGGDPTRVTIHGESAGAASVHLHLHSPLSTGLFSAAIGQSASSLVPWALAPVNLARQRAEAFAILTGCPTSPTKELTHCLKQLSADEIVNTHYKFYIWDREPNIPFAPVVEPDVKGAFLPRSPWKQNPVNNVPYLIGINSAEGGLKVARLLFNGAELLKELRDSYQRYLPLTINILHLIQDNATLTRVTDKILKYYLGDKKIGVESIPELLDLYSDAYFTHCSIEAALRHQNTVYFYYYDHRNEKSCNDFVKDENVDLGVSHADEMQSLFYTPIFTTERLNEIDTYVSERVVNYWTNFAYYKNPNKNNEDLWKPMTSKDMEYLHMSTENDVMKKDILKSRYNFWKSLPFFDSLRSLEYTKDEL